MKIGELILKLTVDPKTGIVNLKQFEGEVNKTVASAKVKVSSLGQAFAGISKFGERVFFSFQGFRALMAPIGEMTAAANRASGAQRQLEATSKITGVSLGLMQQTAAKAKDEFNLTSVQSNEFTIALSKLTNKAGEVDKMGDALAALLDVGAAQNRSAEDTLLRINQAILGLDEGTDALFGKNPSVIYAEYAKQIGTTAGKLTDQQKAQALLNEVMATGLLVQGEYAKFLDSNAGRQAQATARLEEMKAKWGELIQQALIPLLNISIPVMQFFTAIPSAGQRVIAVLGGITLAAVKLIPSLIALGATLGPIGWTFAAIAGLGATTALMMGNTAAETAKLKQEMLESSPVNKGYQESLGGVRKEIDALQQQMEKFDAATLSKKLEEARAKISAGIGKVFEFKVAFDESAAGQARDKLREQLDEVEKELTASGERMYVARRRQLFAIKALTEKQLASSNSVNNLVQLAQALDENVGNATALQKIITQINAEIETISLDKNLSEEAQKELANFSTLIGELGGQAQLVFSLQASLRQKQTQESITEIDKQVKLLEVDKARAGQIQDQGQRLQKTYEISRKELELRKEIATLSGKKDDVTKIETELQVLKDKLKIEQEILATRRRQELDQALGGLQKQGEDLTLQIEEQRRLSFATTESEKLDIKQEFAARRLQVEEQSALSELQIKFQGLETDQTYLAARQQLTENFETRRQLLSQQSTEQIKKQLADLQQFTASTTLETKHLAIDIQESEELAALLADRSKSVDEQQAEEIRIRERYALARIALEQQTALAELQLRFAGLTETDAYKAASLALIAKYDAERERLAQDSASRLAQIAGNAAKQAQDAFIDMVGVIESSWSRMWSNMIRDSKAKPLQELWNAIRENALLAIGDILQADITAALRSLSVHQAAETAKTTATGQGAAARVSIGLAALAKEIAGVIKSVFVFLAQAAAKLFSWFASLGPLGIAAGLAAVPTVIGAARAVVQGIGKFDKGAVLTGPTLGLLAEGSSTELALPLNDRGAEFVSRVLPKISLPAQDNQAILAKLDQLAKVFIDNRPVIHANLDEMRFFRRAFPKYQRLEKERTL